MSNLPSSIRSLLFIGVTLLVALGFLVLPRRIAFILFILLVVYPALTAVIYYLVSTSGKFVVRIGRVVKSFLLAPVDPDLSTRRLRPVHLVELLLIVLLTLFALRYHYDFHPDMRVRGHEIEWLTGGGELAYQSLNKYGYLPLWNPFYRQGEPLVDNAFSYLLNPFSSIPHLLFGSVQGTKYAVTINAMLAGVGGWFLAWVLGLSGAGRLTLALLIMGKGNMHANFDSGYYQLAAQQVYFPWVFAGLLALFKTGKRWSLILTAVSASLMFFAGNLWHLLPTAMCIAVLVLLYGWSGKRPNWTIIRRMIAVTLISAGICAVTLISIAAHYGLIEAHPDEYRAGWEVLEPNRTYLLPFVSNYEFATEDLLVLVPKSDVVRDVDIEKFSESAALHFYYSYVSPWWFVILILLPVPLAWRYRKSVPQHRRLWVAGVGFYVFFTMWGMGGTPLFLWLYDNVPYVAQWRFVPRALGMASFWVAVLVALRVDTLLRTLAHRLESMQTEKRRNLYQGLLTFYILLTSVAVLDVIGHWSDDPLFHVEPQLGRCMQWLDTAEPDREHAVWIHGYDRMTHVLRNEIRMVNIEADFLPTSLPNTIGDPRIDSRLRFTERRMIQQLDFLDSFLMDGYRQVKASPTYFRLEHCLYENKDYWIPYAFTFELEEAIAEYPSDKRHHELANLYLGEMTFQPVIGYERLYDTVAIMAQADSEHQQVLVIQELGYPGWEVWVDGERYPIDVFARWNAVKLPLDDEIHEVVFMYRPPLVYAGAMITMLTILGIIIYLLRLDHFLLRR